MRRGAWIVVAGIALPGPALARDEQIMLQAGTAGQAAIELARQTGTSIVIADPAIARRTVGSLRGRMAAGQAIRMLARAAGARAVKAGRGAWRFEAAGPAKPPKPPADARPISAPPQGHIRPPEQAVAGPPIVVFASKRDLRIGQVAGQVAILDGEALAFGGVGGTEKITQKLATVSSTHLGSGRNKLFIRGIADSSFTGPTQATVGQYLGDLRLTYNAPDPDLRLSDLSRVEVLEGPQGTLYGAGALGGIIRVVPNPPQLGTTSFSGTVGGSLTQGGAGGGDASGVVNLPIIAGTAALRASLDAASLGGYIDKPVLGRQNVNRTHILGGRIALRVRAGPDWTVDVLALGQSTHDADSQYADRGGAPLTSLARVAEGADARYAMGQVMVSGQIGALRVRSTTGIVRQTLHERYDASADADSPRLFTQANRTRMFANESRIWMPERGGFSWLLGGSFTHNQTTLSRAFETPQLHSAATGVRNTIDEATLYGEASLRLIGPLEATAGGRFTVSKLEGAGLDVAPAIALARAEVTADRWLRAFLPSFALHAELAAQTSLYMRYQQGFRPGGFAIEGDFVRRFRNDRTRTFEVGARHGQSGSGPFDLSLNLSYTRWQDIQADFIDSTGLPSTANIGDGRVWSASLSGGAELLQGFRLEAGVTLNQSKVDKPDLANAALAVFFMRSMQVPNIAHVAARTGFSWTGELGDNLQMAANGWVSYIGRSRLGIGPELGAAQGDYLDSGINLRVGTQRSGVTLGVTNLANARGNRFSLGTPFSTGRSEVTPLRPRTVRLGFDTRF